MKIMLLADRSSIHTVKWASGLVNEGIEIHLVSINENGPALDARVHTHFLPNKGKGGYICNILSLKRLLKIVKPDILHAHYASGYGTLAALSRYKPFIISVWGSDIYNFPYKSIFHLLMIRWVLRSANLICSTSFAMKAQVEKICNPSPPIEVVPFGVDTDLFRPISGLKDPKYFTVGLVKSLYPKYGVDILINSFSLFKHTVIDENALRVPRLLIIGEGPEENALRALCKELRLESDVIFMGKIDNQEIPKHLNSFDIFVALSRDPSESFGVALVEALACGTPVIASAVPGFIEVIKNTSCGQIVPIDNPVEAAAAIKNYAWILTNKSYRSENELTCIESVKRLYSAKRTIKTQIHLYQLQIYTNR